MKPISTVFVHLLILLNHLIHSVKSKNVDKPIPTVQVEALVGHTTKLPCQMNSTKSSDVFLVLWYIDLDGKPIYSFDRRRTDDGKRWSAEHPFGGRAYFQENPYISNLIIKDVKKEDEGVYRCRVDYEDSPTRNYKVNLSIIVPPSSPRIRSRGRDIISNGILGPVAENEMIDLTCDTVGGYPIPELTWWLDGQLIDSTYHLAHKDTVINDLQEFKMLRHMDGSLIECKANNTLVSNPSIRSLALDMHLRPLRAKIHINENLEEHKKYRVRCAVFGSKPPPVIEWYINKQKMDTKYTSDLITKEDKTVSILNYVGEASHNELNLTCKAYNRMILYDFVEDTVPLIVQYKPKVAISFGRNINANQIKEGDDVYFECNIMSYPKAYKVSWMKNEDVIKPSRHQGIIISNLSLVIQNVKRADAGMYTCLAENSVGVTDSNKIELKIKYSPMCNSMPRKIGSVIGSNITVICDVDAYPNEVTYQWWFLGQGRKSQRRMLYVHTQTFVHRVESNEDFGSVYCQAKNEVGWQNQACMFDIHPGGLPDTVKNCTIETHEPTLAIKIQCIPGTSGGLEQQFVLKVYDNRASKDPFSIVNKMEPTFVVQSLDFSEDSQFFVFAQNPVGLSPGVKIATSLVVGMKQEQNPEDDGLFQLIVTGSVLIVGVLLVMCCYLIIINKRRCSLRC